MKKQTVYIDVLHMQKLVEQRRFYQIQKLLYQLHLKMICLKLKMLHGYSMRNT